VNEITGADRIDEARMAAWLALLEAHEAVLSALEDRLQTDAGLPLAWHEVLVRLAGVPEGRMRMNHLARSLLLSKSGATRLIDRMVESGMVARQPCSSDRRVTYAVITDVGRDALRQALPGFVDSFDKAFSRHLSDRETAALQKALRRILEGNGRGDPPVCPSIYVGGVEPVAAATR
jgi:DNA-binding MarR family transcriptional regulator